MRPVAVANAAADRIDTGRSYDVIVVGGGINGCALLWEAARQGFSAILLERGDYCAETSANTLKVIHSGIRYLQTLALKRVWESVAERDALMRLAPHLVRPLSCLTPTSGMMLRSRWAAGLAWLAFDAIRAAQGSGAASIGRNRVLSKAECLRLVPWLADEQGLSGAALWYDAQVVNAERLGLAFVLSAQALGADACNYAEVEDLIVREGRVSGVRVRDVLTGGGASVTGRTVVVAAGASLPGLLSTWHGDAVAAPRFVRAANIVTTRRLSDVAVGRASRAGAGEQRLLFAAPWAGRTLIGTWYFPGDCNSHPGGQPCLTHAELSVCLRDVEATFPGGPLGEEEIALVHTGLLPAQGMRGAAASHRLSEKEKIFEVRRAGRETGLIAVVGVKYTTARSVARKALRYVGARLSGQPGGRAMPETTLYGGDIGSLDAFVQAKAQEYEEIAGTRTVARLAGLYGSKLDAIMRLAARDARMAETIPGVAGSIKAELRYVLENESAWTLCDALVRRTGIGGRARPTAQTIAYFADTMAAHFGWNDAARQANIDAVDRYYERIV